MIRNHRLFCPRLQSIEGVPFSKPSRLDQVTMDEAKLHHLCFYELRATCTDPALRPLFCTAVLLESLLITLLPQKFQIKLQQLQNPLKIQTLDSEPIGVSSKNHHKESVSLNVSAFHSGIHLRKVKIFIK